jgi:hypothetical protein
MPTGGRLSEPADYRVMFKTSVPVMEQIHVNKMDTEKGNNDSERLGSS